MIWFIFYELKALNFNKRDRFIWLELIKFFFIAFVLNLYILFYLFLLRREN